LDPFISKFLDSVHAYPEDLSLNLVRVLVGFTTICRSFGYEPSVDFLAHFYIVSKDNSGSRLIGRVRPYGIKLFQDPPSKIDDWGYKAIWVESSRGWPFNPNNGKITKMGSPGLNYSSAYAGFEDAIIHHLGVRKVDGKIVEQKYVFDWKELARGEFYILSGQAGENFETSLPRLPICHLSPHLDWKIHLGEAFSSMCKRCNGDLEDDEGFGVGIPKCRPGIFKEGTVCLFNSLNLFNFL
jgi:hypothetical protein